MFAGWFTVLSRSKRHALLPPAGHNGVNGSKTRPEPIHKNSFTAAGRRYGFWAPEQHIVSVSLIRPLEVS